MHSKQEKYCALKSGNQKRIILSKMGNQIFNKKLSIMIEMIPDSWNEIIASEFTKPYFKELTKFVINGLHTFIIQIYLFFQLVIVIKATVR